MVFHDPVSHHNLHIHCHRPRAHPSTSILPVTKEWSTSQNTHLLPTHKNTSTHCYRGGCCGIIKKHHQAGIPEKQKCALAVPLAGWLSLGDGASLSDYQFPHQWQRCSHAHFGGCCVVSMKWFVGKYSAVWARRRNSRVFLIMHVTPSGSIRACLLPLMSGGQSLVG